MSHPENDSQVTRGIEIRRREAAVKVGRQQVRLMEKERKLESEERRIKELLRRNHGLKSLLEEIEKENEEELQEARVEVARRQKVVKLWRMQAKVTERERRLEKLLDSTMKIALKGREGQDSLEELNQLLEHAHSEDNLETVENLREFSSLSDGLPYIVIEKQIQEEEEEAQALR